MTRESTFSRPAFHLLLIAVFASVAVGTAAFKGIPAGNDLSQHYQFAASVNEALSNGEYYPSLAQSPNRGVSDYGFRFYPPLAYYALAVAFKLVGSWFAASILVFFLVFFAGGAGVYYWVSETFGPRQAMIAAALFTFAPYHLNQIYNNFLFAEFAASAVIPFCFLFLHRTATRPSAVSAAGLAAAYGLLILTHLPSTIIGSVAFALYGLVVMYRCGTWLRSGLALAASVAAGLAATSFYWIKLVTELDWINHARQEFFSGIYSYQSNFLLHPANIYNLRDDVLAIWMGDLMLLAMVLVSIPSAVVIWRNKEKVAPLLAASLTVFAAGAFLSSVLSKPLWDNLGFLQSIQFPWRWMGVVSVAGAVFASFGISKLTEKDGEKPGIVMNAVLLFALLFFTVSAVFITRQAVFIPAEGFTNQKVEGMLSDPSRDCWWTVWADENFYRTAPEQASIENRPLRVRRWSALEKEIGVGPGPESEAVFAVLFYPHWRAYIDGERTDVSRTETGLISVTVPKNAQSVTLRFREPDTVRAAAIVSTSAFALIVFTLLLSLVRRTFRKPAPEGTDHPQLKG